MAGSRADAARADAARADAARADAARAEAASERAAIYTTADAGRSLPSHGPEWDAAIEFGVDVTLIVHNLELTVEQRLEQAAAHQRFIDEVHQHTLTPELREQLELARLWEKIDALGGPDPNWPAALQRRPETLAR